MVQKIFIKVLLLFISLGLVYAAMSFFASSDFKQSVSDLFGGSSLKTYGWCPDHSIDFEWLDASVSPKWKSASADDIRQRFCRVTLKPLLNVDLSKISFKPLLKVQSAEAKTAQLEWSPGTSVFQANGMPFYSTSLGREILDK